MPRQARLDAPGALHHIIIRGINRSPIFKDDEDKRLFLQRLGRTVTEGQCSVYAWVLMANHVHLLFKSGKHSISTVMRRVLTWYAQYFNRKHHRSGHLFENRYKSILCDEETYLLALVRYLHLNPMRAKIVSTLDELDRYRWSGHRAILGKVSHSWMETEYVLSRFGKSRRKAHAAYRRFIEEGMGMGRNAKLTGGKLVRDVGGWSGVLSLRTKGKTEKSDGRILGNGDFVQSVLQEIEDGQLRQLRLRRKGITIQDIIQEECGRYGVSTKELVNGSRRSLVSNVRATIAYRCMEEVGVSAAEIARQLGVTTSSITRGIERVKDQR